MTQSPTSVRTESGQPANDNSEMVPLWVCLRRSQDAAQMVRASRRLVRRD